MIFGQEVFDPVEVGTVAAAHRDALGDSVLTLLGQNFLEDFYRCALRSELEWLYFNRVSGRIAAVCLASLEPGSLLRRAVSSQFPGFVVAASSAFRHSASFRSIAWGTLKDSVARRPAPGAPEIVLVYALRDFRRRGIAKQIVTTAEQHLGELGHDKCFVRTLDDPTNGALAFYSDLGYSRIGTAKTGGREFITLSKTLIAKGGQGKNAEQSSQ